MVKEKEIAIVYVVAGLSSRFGGKVKQFVKVGPNGESLIEYSVKQAISAGFNKIIFVVGEKTEKGFKEMFGNNYSGIKVKYAYQKYDKSKRDKPWGTLDALCCSIELVDCPFLFCNGDDIYGVNTFKVLADHLKNKKSGAIVGYKLGEVLSDTGGVNRAIIKTNEDNTVKSLEEVFDITEENMKDKGLTKKDLCSMNTFAFQPEILIMLNELLKEFKNKHDKDRKIEVLIQEEVTKLIKNGKLILKVYTAKDKWFGVTHPDDEVKIRNVLLTIR